jgi:hypothetical protein
MAMMMARLASGNHDLISLRNAYHGLSGGWVAGWVGGRVGGWMGGWVGGWVGGRLARGGAAMQTTPFLFPCLPGCLS